MRHRWTIFMFSLVVSLVFGASTTWAVEPITIYAEAQNGYLMIPAPATGFPVTETPYLIPALEVGEETIIVEIWRVIVGQDHRVRLTQKLLGSDGSLPYDFDADQVFELRPYRILSDGSKELIVRDWIFFTYTL